MTDLAAAEDAVRRYLAWVADPSTLVDPAALAIAEAAFAVADDPLARLHAAADLERAKVGDPDALRAAFVAHARTYAQHNDIPVQAFRALGVDDGVLGEAGFALPSSRGRRGPAAASGRRSATGATKPRAPQVGVAQLQAAALELADPFSLAELVEAAGGGSPITARKAVEGLLADGRLVDLGTRTEHRGPGRAPKEYRRA